MNKALFIDRDGTINHMVNYMGNYDSPQKVEDVTLVEGVESLIASLNKKGILVIQVSNQPGVAKGKMSQTTSNKIEEKVHSLLSERGAKINHRYICPHHPKGTVPELSIECDCRKPKPGLLLQAARDHNIELSKSIFLGDKASDVQAGKISGCKTILLLHENDTAEKIEQAKNSDADFKITSYKEAIQIVNRSLLI